MTTPTVEATTILAARLGEARETIAKANKRLAKAGIAERFTLNVGEPYDYIYHDGMGFRHAERRVAVSLDYPSIGYNGWTFVATLVFEEGGTVVRNVPGQECSYRPATKVCDQCHTDRYRTETFVVRNDETGEHKQVGRNCLGLFFGLKPTLWVFSYNPEFDALSEHESEGGGYGHNDSRVALLDVVAAALAVSNEGRAYKPASFEGNTTKGQTLEVLFGRHVPVKRSADSEYNAWLDESRVKTAEYKANGVAAQVVAHVQTLKGDSEYAENARVLANSEYVAIKNVGIVASFAKLWANEKQYAAEREAKAQANAGRVNEYFGTVGDKVVVEGVVTKLREFEGSFGTSMLVEVLSVEGYTFKSFSTAQFVWKLAEGDKVQISGTVKKHEEYKGYKATMLARIKAV